MMERRLEEILSSIDELGQLSSQAMEEASARQEVLAKPTGALGELEEISIRLAGITGQVKNDVTKQAIVIFSAARSLITARISPVNSGSRALVGSSNRRTSGFNASARAIETRCC